MTRADVLLSVCAVCLVAAGWLAGGRLVAALVLVLVGTVAFAFALVPDRQVTMSLEGEDGPPRASLLADRRRQ